MLSGRCLCRATAWCATAEPIWQSHCHCELCRRAVSSGVAPFVAVPREGFAWTGREPASYASSVGVTRCFCATCGSPLCYESETRPDEVHLYAATLDDPERVAPTRHDFWDERVPWLTFGDGLPRREGE